MRDYGNVNGFSKVVRTLFVSVAAIILCIALMVAGSYALFSDSVTIGNHLQAGTMDITLERTKLTYAVLGKDGSFTPQTDNTVVDFSEETEANVFGLSKSNTETENPALIVPGSYFEATMKLTNKGNVAFDYSIKLVFGGENGEDLPSQLKLTVTAGSTTVVDKPVSELGDGYVTETLGSVYAAGSETNAEQTFTVKLEFVNGDSNNAAQAEKASFDLVVIATQKTVTAA